jgi:hypothetical protein
MDRFDVVLPLHPRDLPRARILASTMKRFLGDVETVWIVGRKTEAQALAEELEPKFRCRTLEDRDVVPEVASARAGLARLRKGRYVVGHNVQQLVKLGMSRRVETPFYLTLDADVLLVRPVDASWLLPGGRARTVRFRGDGHPGWYESAARILDLPPSSWEHGVTPCVLARDCTRSLLAYLDRTLEGRAGSAEVEEDPHGSGRWRGYLLVRRGWTEYTLYHTFAEAAGAFDARHHPVGPQDFYSANVWKPDDRGAWRASDAFGEGADGDFRFTVVQSTAGVDPEELARRVEPFLDPTR